MKVKEFVVNLSFDQYQSSISFYPVFATTRENAVLLAEHLMKVHGASSYVVKGNEE